MPGPCPEPNATALTLAVARFKEQWPQIQLDYDPVLLSPKSVLPRRGNEVGVMRPFWRGVGYSDPWERRRPAGKLELSVATHRAGETPALPGGYAFVFARTVFTQA